MFAFTILRTTVMATFKNLFILTCLCLGTLSVTGCDCESECEDCVQECWYGKCFATQFKWCEADYGKQCVSLSQDCPSECPPPAKDPCTHSCRNGQWGPSGTGHRKRCDNGTCVDGDLSDICPEDSPACAALGCTPCTQTCTNNSQGVPVCKSLTMKWCTKPNGERICVPESDQCTE